MAYIAEEPKDEDENVDMLIPIVDLDDERTLYYRVPYRRKYHFRVFDNLETGDDW